MKPWLALPLLLIGACAAPDTVFRVTRSPRFAAASSGVSVFGVFKSGRMNPEYWDEIGGAISQAFDWNSCETAFGERLQSVDPALFTRLDETAKESGVTPELLGLIAPRAMGHLVMAMSVTGRPRDEQHAERALALANRPPAGARSRQSGGAGGLKLKKSTNDSEGEALDLTLSLFSVSTHEIVAEVDMRYAGFSLQEALSRFSERVRSELPGLSCMGWKWEETR